MLQRLARDGWITIQHGKPTQVNDFMQTAGLNILDTLLTLEGQDITAVLQDLLMARNDIGTSFMANAINHNSDEARKLVESIILNCENIQKSANVEEFLLLISAEECLQIQRELKTIPDEFKEDAEFYRKYCLAKAFAYCDFHLFQGMATASGNSVYLLTMNGMRRIYCRVASYYFLNSHARLVALDFYRGVLALCDHNNGNGVKDLIRTYSHETKKIWDENRDKVRTFLAQEG